MADSRDQSPFLPLIEMIVKMISGRGVDTPLQQYPGTQRAGQSPMATMARQMMMQRAGSGGPQAWQNAQQFANTYSGGPTNGVFNPFTSQVESQQPGGGGMGQGPGQGGPQGPPMLGGGQGQGSGMGGGGGSMPPQLMQMIMQMMQNGGGGGGGNPAPRPMYPGAQG